MGEPARLNEFHGCGQRSGRWCIIELKAMQMQMLLCCRVATEPRCRLFLMAWEHFAWRRLGACFRMLGCAEGAALSEALHR
jgi:hypothetical protein